MPGKVNGNGLKQNGPDTNTRVPNKCSIETNTHSTSLKKTKRQLRAQSNRFSNTQSARQQTHINKQRKHCIKQAQLANTAESKKPIAQTKTGVTNRKIRKGPTRKHRTHKHILKCTHIAKPASQDKRQRYRDMNAMTEPTKPTWAEQRM